MPDTERPIIIQPAKVTRVLGYIIALLVLGNVATQAMKYVEWHTFLRRLLHFFSPAQIMKMAEWLTEINRFVRMFDMDLERSVPTYFSTLILLLSALFLFMIARFKKQTCGPYVIHWRIMAIIFLFMSVDETVGIHERFNYVFGGGWLSFNYSWVILGGPLVIVFVLSYCRFLLHLQNKTKILFTIAGVVYVGGAIGAEVVGGRYYKTYGPNNWTFITLVTVEETLEMTGIVLFIYTLLDYMRLNEIGIRLRIGSPD